MAVATFEDGPASSLAAVSILGSTPTATLARLRSWPGELGEGGEWGMDDMMSRGLRYGVLGFAVM